MIVPEKDNQFALPHNIESLDHQKQGQISQEFLKVLPVLVRPDDKALV